MLFLALRAYEHDHSFAFEVRHIVRFAVLGKVGGEASQKQLTLLLEHDRTSTEEYIGFYLVTLLEELNRVFEFEVVVMIVGLRTETDLLDFLFLRIRFRLFLLFLLGVKELLVIYHAAYRRISGCCDLNQVEILLIGYTHSLLERVDSLFYIVADKANLGDSAYLVIDTMRVFFDNATATRSGSNCSYCFNYLWLIILLLVRAQSTLPSKKRTKLLLFFHIRKNFGFFLHFFCIYRIFLVPLHP